jgi:hypothetical protein
LHHTSLELFHVQQMNEKRRSGGERRYGKNALLMN